MKQVQKIRLRPYPIFLGILVLLFLFGAGVSLIPRMVSAHAAGATLTPGTYACTNTFLSGPMSGQTEQVTLTFNSNGTLSSSVAAAGLSGQGYWWVDNVQDGSNTEVNYSFREALPASFQTQFGVTDVQVVHLIISFQNGGKSFTSQGYGLAYNGSTFAIPSKTTTTCTAQ